jgi:hypothetical protein
MSELLSPPTKYLDCVFVKAKDKAREEERNLEKKGCIRGFKWWKDQRTNA